MCTEKNDMVFILTQTLGLRYSYTNVQDRIAPHAYGETLTVYI